MDNETEKIFADQLRKLPEEVTSFLSSAGWEESINEIGALYNLSGSDLYGFNREVTLVLLGIVHPNALGGMLEQEVGVTNRAILDALVANVEDKIFAHIRPALIEFFQSELDKNEAVEEEIPVGVEEDPSKDQEKSVDTAPDNLPTGDIEEPLFPPIPAKTTVSPVVEGPIHPFEEKMKMVFTAGQQSLGELTLETPAPEPGGLRVGEPTALHGWSKRRSTRRGRVL